MTEPQVKRDTGQLVGPKELVSDHVIMAVIDGMANLTAQHDTLELVAFRIWKLISIDVATANLPIDLQVDLPGFSVQVLFLCNCQEEVRRTVVPSYSHDIGVSKAYSVAQ